MEKVPRTPKGLSYFNEWYGREGGREGFQLLQ